MTLRVYNYVGMPILGLQRNEEAFSRAVRFITGNLASGKLKPVVAKTFPLHKIQAAHRYMEENYQLGKIVVTV